MGNSQTREARGHSSTASPRVVNSGPASPAIRQDSHSHGTDQSPRLTYSSRPRQTSRSEFSFLGISKTNDQDASSLEAKRENKQEREARRTEKERQARLKERERSMKEEHVDGGYLVTQGVYVGVEDYNKAIVRQLMIERRLAPFWRGLNDFSESWAEHQLIAAARGLPIPPADQVPPELEYHLIRKASPEKRKEKAIHSLTVPIGPRSQSYQSDSSAQSPINNSMPLPSPSPPPTSSSPSGPFFRTRAKTLAALTTSSRNNTQTDMTPRELQLPIDPFVNGQPIEAYLYKDASECPICFLYYPPYLNTTRCCEQSICSECFVQIKRPDPHPPEHEQPDPNAPPVSEAEREAQAEGLLVSEVATCPYCKQPEFGITYAPPPFRRGLTYGTGSQPYQIMSAMSSQTSVSSSGMSPGPGRRRGTSISANAPEVITTDKVRPDWANKLATARATAARRSAAATALHTAAYVMNGQGDTRAFGPFARRSMLRRPPFDGADSSANPHLSALAMLAERHAARQQMHGIADPRASPFLPPPRGSSSRRSGMDEIEEMMMMEAIRLSLASEEERRRKEEKESRKKAKKEEKEIKKAEKAARKNSLFATTSNTLDGSSADVPIGRSRSDVSSQPEDDDDDDTSGKGKSIDRTSTPPIDIPSKGTDELRRTSDPPGMSLSGTSQESLASSTPAMGVTEPLRRSHLRQMSTASSASSSFIDPSPNTFSGSNTPPPGSLEPMFNFRSLAAVIGVDDKVGSAAQVDDGNSEARLGSLENIQDGASLIEPTSPTSVTSHESLQRSSERQTEQNGNVKK